MGSGVYFVFSNPPPGVGEDEYAAFYERHAGEIVAGPGFAGARRYWLSPVKGGPPTNYRHLSLYDLEADSRSAMAELGKRMQAGELTLPDWFGQIQFASFDGLPLGDETLELPDHLYLVFSKCPDPVSHDDYEDWYATHVRENLTADFFEAGARFRLEPETVDPSAPCGATHAALYDVGAPLPQLQQSLVESREDGRRHTYPDWFAQIEFASVDCAAASPYIAAAVASR